MAHQGLQVLSQFRVGDGYPLSSTLCVLTSRPAHDLLGLASEVGEHGAGIVEVLEGVADVFHLILQELRAAYSEGPEEETNDHAFFGSLTMGRKIVNEIIFICGFSVY